MSLCSGTISMKTEIFLNKVPKIVGHCSTEELLEACTLTLTVISLTLLLFVVLCVRLIRFQFVKSSKGLHS